MKKHDTFLMFGLIGLSVITSFLFIMYGMNVIMAESAARGILTFAYVTTAYGLANIAIVSLAWSSREAWADGASKFISLCYLGVFTMDMLNSGLNSPIGAAGILALALILGANWFAVKKIITRA